jgi:DNA primase
MSPRVRQGSVDAVAAAADLVDVISGYTSLRKRGLSYTGLCPFHQEKTPSFSVSAERGLYYCFGCGEGGNVFTFLQRVENLSFQEAVETLAGRYGLEVEYEEGAAPDAGARDREKRLQTLLEKSAAFFQRLLWESEEGATARGYLEERGLRAEVCREFRVGLAPQDWRGLHRRAAREGFSDKEMEEAGLLIRRPDKVYDRFRGRLMFPLLDHRGRVVGFGGRTLTGESPKYLNSPEGPLYQKGRLLYGLFQARRAIGDADEVLIVEGYTDVLALVQADTRNVVASMGTALTEGQVQLMTRFTTNLVFMFDADRAGAEAALRSGELTRGLGLRPQVVVLPAGSDPADAAIGGGPDAVRRLVTGRISLLRYEIRRVLDQGDTATADGRVRAFEQVRGVLARARSPKEREEEIAYIADRLRLSSENVGLLLRQPLAARAPRGGTQGAKPHPGASTRPVSTPHLQRVLTAETTVEQEFLVAAVSHPSLARPLLEGLTPEHFADPVHREAFMGLREALSEKDATRVLKDRAAGDSDLGRFFIRIIMEADGDKYSSGLLHRHYWGLQDAKLGRAIAELRSGLDTNDASADRERERHINELEQLRHHVREALTGVEGD